MKILEIDSTALSPSVFFSPDEGLMKIEGRSIPENPEEFYSQIFLWIKEYFVSPQDHTDVNFMLEYVNSGSTKFLIEMMRMLKKFIDDGASVTVRWYFEEEDEAIEELGEHFLEMVKLPIEMIPVR